MVHEFVELITQIFGLGLGWDGSAGFGVGFELLAPAVRDVQAEDHQRQEEDGGQNGAQNAVRHRRTTRRRLHRCVS